MIKKLLSNSGLLWALGLFVAINIIANNTLTSMRMDVTESKLFTPSQGTKNILRNLEEPITLRFFFSAKTFSGIPTLLNYGARVRDMLEEFATNSNGKLRLIITDPEPFSEAEDEAVGYGIQQLPISTSGDLGYFGLVGTNTTDDEFNIPFFQPEKEQSLEYELTKMIYRLSNPVQRVIGVISPLPLLGPGKGQGPGMPPGSPPEAGGSWAMGGLIEAEYALRDLGVDVETIDDEIDTLMVVHPKELSGKTRFAIDQFVLAGGRAMIFVDPLAEEDKMGPNAQNPMMMPSTSSDLPDLFKAWGIQYDKEKVAGDLDAAIRVAYSADRGTQEIEYMPWLQLDKAHLNQEDFSTSELNMVNVGSAGILEKADDAKTEFIPLIKTGKRAMAYERDAMIFVRDPAGLLNSFKSGDKELVLAARISGKVNTAFPDGPPQESESDDEGQEDEAGPGEVNDDAKDDKVSEEEAASKDYLKESKEPINVIVVADSDIVADKFWVRFQNFLGMRVPSEHADNARFVINTLDILGGNQDMISLRSRSAYTRPFHRVDAIRKEAEVNFRAKEQVLQAKLQETDTKLQALQKDKEGGQALLLSSEQREEIEKFRAEQLSTRKDLRNVQHELQKDIDSLGSSLKFFNIGLMPLLIVLLAIGVPYYRNRKKKALLQGASGA